jgi:putative spermidine/putrescine transport system ATP-binding protein
LRLEVRGLTKSYRPGPPAVDAVSHGFAAGRITSILGPSGSGKSTLLWMIAGLAAPDAGRVLCDEADVTDVPAEKREVGLVFQSYALFPHLTVLENVAFGPRARGASKAERTARAREALATVRMSALAGRRIEALSGGEQQRVALARALACRPRVLLLDEPLSALDAQLREELRGELSVLLRSLALTTLYVTHDQEEALSLGDELLVLRDGRVEQSGTPADVYRRPANAFVARFLGAANLVRATAAPGGQELRLPFATLPATAPVRPGPCWVMLRPEDLEVVRPGEGDFTASLETSVFRGSARRLRVVAGGEALAVDAPNDLDIREGEDVSLRVRREKISVFPEETG